MQNVRWSTIWQISMACLKVIASRLLAAIMVITSGPKKESYFGTDNSTVVVSEIYALTV
jgi:hypothetical protein